MKKFLLILPVLMMLFVACSHDDDDRPAPDVETVRLIISVPATSVGTRMGDPGIAVDEGADWDEMAVILAYSDNSKVRTTTITQEQFNALPAYNGNTNFKLLAIDAEPGKVYIYGVTYSNAAANNPGAAITSCTTNAEVQALTISNAYSEDNGTIDYAKFVSVATGYYKGDGTTPAEFEIKKGGTGEIGNIPTMTLTRLAAKIDIQWDAADAYDQGYTDVKVTEFTYDSGNASVVGVGFGRLFPDLYTGTDAIGGSKEFYNTSEISQRNGRVYHYVFPDGVSKPSVTFNISAKKTGVTPDPSADYTLTFKSALQKATWYKVNTWIKGITGNGTIELDMSGTGT
ncbi:hypothetical protein [uncultured Prevotella sp.]|uniref:hypothetical protein n=1 Tax=uncultured Prevotella sp. TaxID=159272 RepID=UPI00263085B9|nr:hypothetical protein [uncultured Prevotella sp.]